MRNNRHRALLFASIALIAACDTPAMPTPDAPAYEPRLSADEQFIYRWSGGHAIRLFIDPTNEPADVDLAASVRAAIAVWEAVSNLGAVRFEFVANFRDADVIIHHRTAPRLVAPADCPEPPLLGTHATYFCLTEDFRVSPLRPIDGGRGSVKMDVFVSRELVDSPQRFNEVVAHEIGHILGIGLHSPTPTDLMYAFPQTDRPSADDTQTLRWVLSQRADVRF